MNQCNTSVIQNISVICYAPVDMVLEYNACGETLTETVEKNMLSILTLQHEFVNFKENRFDLEALI